MFCCLSPEASEKTSIAHSKACCVCRRSDNRLRRSEPHALGLEDRGPNKPAQRFVRPRTARVKHWGLNVCASALVLMVSVNFLCTRATSLGGIKGSLYPLWGAGSNRNGALDSVKNVGVSEPNQVPSQVLNFSDVGVGNEIVFLSAGQTHVIAQTVNETSGSCGGVPLSSVPRKTWSWGVNKYGQLGRTEGAGSNQAVRSSLLPRSSFPRRKLGNEISADHNRNLTFSRWSNSLGLAEEFNITVSSGVKGLTALSDEINDLVGVNAIALDTDAETEKVVVSVIEPGYQISFYGGKQLAEALGFVRPFRLPQNSVLNEISARLENNLLVFSHHEGTIRIRQADGNNFFYFKAWEDSTGQVSDWFELDVPDNDYTPSGLSQVLNNMVSALGFPSDLFSFGPDNLDIPGFPEFTWNYAGYAIDFDSSLAGAGLLGFTGILPDPSLFHGQVPNEVSLSAGTNTFEYRYTDASYGLVPQNFSISITWGARDADTVLSEIASEMSLRGHPNALRLYFDAESRAVLEIRQAGFQVMLNKDNTVGKYLGLGSMVVPCNPSEAGCHLSAADVVCLGAVGCVTGSSIVRARGSSPRPFLSLVRVASGSCSSGFACACNVLSASSTAVCINETATQTADSASGGTCSCGVESSYQKITATRSWAGLQQYAVRFDDGIYDLATLNQALLAKAPPRFGSAVFMVFEARGGGRATLVVQMENVQVNFDRSTVGELLGFDAVSMPDNFTQRFHFFEAEAPRSTSLLTQTEQQVATEAGDWVLHVAVGAQHTLVQTVNADTGRKRLWAFGSNLYGQLGLRNGSAFDEVHAVPRVLPSSGGFNPNNARAVYAGGDHSAVVDATGKLWVFGRNTHGQLGIDLGENSSNWTATPRNLPRTLLNNATNLSLSLGPTHTLVLGRHTNGTRLWTFGSSRYGKLGRDGESRLPAPVEFELEIEQLCAGGEHSLVLATDGSMWATGLNVDGQLGVGGLQTQTDAISRLMQVGSSFTGSEFVWTDPFSGSRVTSIGCGQHHSVALTADGSAWTFGSNSDGQLMSEGNSNLGNANPIPIQLEDSQFLFNTEVESAVTTACRVGAGDYITFVQTKRLPCLPGTLSADGLQPCHYCALGKYNPFNQSTTCIECPVGSFMSEKGAEQCEPCPKDTYSNATGHAGCTACPEGLPGTLRPGANSQDNCTQLCQPGFFSDVGVPPCDPCPPGSYAPSSQATRCVPCEIGSFQPSNGSSSCIPCTGENSTADLGSNSSEACLPVCAAGESGADGLAPCTACPMGTLSASRRSESCSPCAEDTFANSTGLSACFLCPEGLGTAGNGKDALADCQLECTAGSFSTTFGLEPCEACAAGKFTNSGGQESCQSCLPGTFSDRMSTFCTSCQLGQFSDQLASPNCSLCALGQFQGDTNQTACEPCAHASFANATGMSACFSCAEGLFTNAAASTHPDDCVSLCGAGTASTTGLKPEGDAPCDVCADGREPFNSTTTVDVSDGSGIPGARGCRDCRPGFFALSGFEICQPCPSGTFSNTSGTTNCTDCGLGLFSFPNATVCEACAPGSFAGVRGTGNCSLCARGSYQTLSGQSTCESCDPGSFASRLGTVVGCQGCQEGKFSSESGAAECESCPAGFFSGASARNCTPCEPGTFSATFSTFVCSNCSAGTFSPSQNSTVCQQCAPGSAALPGSSTCDICLVASYSDGNFNARCNDCPGPLDGADPHSTSDAGSVAESDCKEICTAGSFGANGLSALTYQDCELCPPGTFSGSSLSSSCDPCPTGAFSSSPGATECQLCLAGTKVNANNTGCDDCAPGSFSDRDAATECTLCGLGYYAPNPGSEMCFPCDLGRYAQQLGTVECDECPSGTSTPNIASNSSTECDQDCIVGFFNEESNGIERDGSPCLPCAPGTYAPFHKQVTCFACPPGKFQNESGTTFCYDCPFNTYNNSEAAQTCTPCPETPFGETTYTLESGAESSSRCRLFDSSGCQAPRNLGIYPVYAAGSNQYGQTIEDAVVDNDEGDPVLRQVILKCNLLLGAEVVEVAAGGGHTLVQTARMEGVDPTTGRVRVSKALWAFGRNSKGQLGMATESESNTVPILVPRFLFPSFAYGNLVASNIGNDVFTYWAWNSTARMRMMYQITLDAGHYGPGDVLREVATQSSAKFGHPTTAFALDVDAELQSVTLSVVNPGFQIDFTAGNVYEKFGMLPERLPQNGTLNEISSAANNNVFKYRVWCEHWPSCSASTTVTKVIPDGIYSLLDLQREINDVIFKNGHGEGPIVQLDTQNDRVTLKIAPNNIEARMQIIMGEDNNVASFLGFAAGNYPSWGPVNTSDATMTFEAAEDRGWLNPFQFVDSDRPYVPFQVVGTAFGQTARSFALGADCTLVQTWDETESTSRLWAFGSNQYGQLGVETNAGSDASNPVPMVVAGFDEMFGGKRATAFKSSATHTMVQASDDSLWAFGSNQFGQLGVETNFSLFTPVWMPQRVAVEHFFDGTSSELDTDKVESVSLGFAHTLLRTVSNYSGIVKLWSFGSNHYGQLGTELNSDVCVNPYPNEPAATVSCLQLAEAEIPNIVPIGIWQAQIVERRLIDDFIVPTLTYSAAAAGANHSLVEASDGRMWCFGSNGAGECGHEFQAFDDLVYPSPVPILVGTKVLSGVGTLVSPPYECCALWDGNGTGCTAPYGFWPYAGTVQQCPFLGKTVDIFQVGDRHSILRAEDNTFWSFGENSRGQLLRSPNLGNVNPNPETGEIPRINFGVGNQPLLSFELGHDHSLVQTHRPYCQFGNHSVDQREPCAPCEAGSFTDLRGTRTNESVSFDQSVQHPYVTLFNVTYLATQRIVSCSQCGAGNFSGAEGSSACSICEAGTYSFHAASTCHQCEPGSVSGAMTGNCTLCNPGQSSIFPFTECFNCPAGSFSPSFGSRECTPCDVGSFSGTAGLSACAPCPFDTYQNETGSTVCKICPNEKKTSAQGADSVDECTNLCGPGSYGTPFEAGGLGVEPCLPCPRGTATPLRGTSFTCPACPGGNFSSTTGKSSCDVCPAGKYSEDRATACSDCLAGTFSPRGSSECSDCLAGSFSSDLDGSCTLCERGKFNDLPRQTACRQCDDGTFTFFGETVCRDCTPGQEGAGGFCFDCTSGFFSSGNRSLDCFPCPQGTFSGPVASLCTNCTPGYFNDDQNATVCDACIPGTFAASERSVLCDLCPRGSTSGFNSTSCAECDPGFFAPVPGSPFCGICEAGTFSLSNSSVCTNCSAGTINKVDGQSNCTLCVPGYFAFRDGLTTCAACVGGTFGNVSGMAACHDCLAGTVSESNATFCDLCIPGTFADAPRMSACLECSVGSYAEGFASKECAACPNGKTTRGQGAGLFGRPDVVPEFFDSQDDCVAPCSAGSFSSWGIAPCVPCPGGYFNEQNFSYLCRPCRDGSSSAPGSTVCTECVPGTVATSGQPTCLPCDEGSFQPDDGQSLCELCAIGTHQEASGSTRCETCPFRLSEQVFDIFYYRDCRTECAAQIRGGNFSNSTGSPNYNASADTDCCKDATVRSLLLPQGGNLTQGEYSAEEIEGLINGLVFDDIGINQLIKIDVDKLGWSYGDFERKKWRLHLQYGGFQILFSSQLPQSCADGSCIVGDGGRDSLTGGFLRQVGPVFGFVPDMVMAPDAAETLPASGPTTCFLDELPTIDGGCYSIFSQKSNADPIPLTTSEVGTTSESLCQAFCSAGTFNSDGLDTPSDPCDNCNSGFYSNSIGATECTPCLPGSYTGTAGAFARCTICDFGKFQSAYNATSCIFCPIGSFAASQGQSICDTCPPGSFSVPSTQLVGVIANFTNFSVNGVPDTCLECATGYFADQSGGSSCDACAEGSYSQFDAASSCLFCEPGRYSNVSAATSCSTCFAGFRSSHPYSSTHCVPCAAGTFSLIGSSTCSDCPPGQFSDETSSSCSLCPVGFFSDSATSPRCSPCQPGTTAVLQGQSHCDDCAAGLFQDQQNATFCLECPAGTFAAQAASPACDVCGYGEYSKNGSTRCTGCPFSPDRTNTTGILKTDISECAAYCPPGTAGYNGVEPCIVCYPGTTSLGTNDPEPQAGFCNVASVGYMNFNGGGLAIRVPFNGSCVETDLGPCEPCPPGQENPFFGSSECTICPASTYAEGGNANCTACPVNTVSDPGATSEDQCQRFCLRGSFSLTQRQPCSPCLPGTFSEAIGQTVCQVCAQGKYQEAAVQSSCIDCPVAKGTSGVASTSVLNCTGVNEKFLTSPFCLANDVYFRAQGHLSRVEIVERGFGYLPGVVDIVDSPGSGFRATFQTITSENRVANITVHNEGIGYTSSGRVDLFYPETESLSAAADAMEEESRLPQYQGPPGFVPDVPIFDELWAPSQVPMGQSITYMDGREYVSLQTTPKSLLSGCLRGTIEVESSGGGRGFEASYHANGTDLDVCIGRMLGGNCTEGLEQHGAGYASRPRMRVVEHSISAVRVRPNSTTQGCGDSSLGFDAGTARAGGLVGSVFASGGTIESVIVVHGGSGFMEAPSVYPVDSNCTCGTGIGQLSILSQGIGYPAFTAGTLTVEAGRGTGFEGTFVTDLNGMIDDLVIAEVGTGYSSASVIRFCPDPSVWDDTASCCRYDFAVLSPQLQLAGLSVDPGTSCLTPLVQAVVQVHLGLPGTVPGAFDECLEAVLDASSCRCGSEAYNMTVQSGGSGYLPGRAVIISGFDPCSLPCAFNSSSASCIASGLPACELSVNPLNATFNVSATGEITSLQLIDGGAGHDPSTSRVVFAYSDATRCDDGSGDVLDICSQDGTVTGVSVLRTTTVPSSIDGDPVVADGRASIVCIGGASCNGQGFEGTCVLDDQRTVKAITVVNHGVGYDPAEIQNVTCTFLVNKTGNISDFFVVSDRFSGTNMSLFHAVVAGNAAAELAVGKPSGVWGNHDDCLEMMWADGDAFLVAGPLHEVEIRLLGQIATNESKHEFLLLNQDTLMDDRLVWFLQTATGHDEIALVNTTCRVSEDVHPTLPSSNLFVHRSLECTGQSECRGFGCTEGTQIWGLGEELSVVILETSNSSRSMTRDVATTLHIALFKIAFGVGEDWSPFQYRGVPLFDGAVAESWIRNLAFGAEQGGLPFDAMVQASTLQFVHTQCSLCQRAPTSFLQYSPHNSQDEESTLFLRRGLALNTENAYIPLRQDGTRQFLGLERIYNQVRDGTVRMNVDGYLDVEGCHWRNSENIEWIITFESDILFQPFPSIVLFGRVSVTLQGIGQYEDISHRFNAVVYLEENEPFEISASLVSLRSDQGSGSAPLVGSANTSSWTRPFGARWIEFGEVLFTFQAVQYPGVDGVNVTHFQFECNGTAMLLDDPWTLGGPGETVAVTVRGNSGLEFPHVYAEIYMDVSTADPAAVIRTFAQEAMNLSYSNPVCGTTAGRDLAFREDSIRFLYSTWDAYQYAVPSQDVRMYNCITRNGTAPTGSPCHFPFQYNGQVFTECTTQDWSVPWCATSSTFDGAWGECVCDKLRRGLYLTGDVRLSQDGPLNLGDVSHPDRLARISNVLSPLMAVGEEINDLHGMLEVFYPWFDSGLSNDLELLILFAPNSREICDIPNRTVADPNVSNAPSGECERLGFVTEWLGAPGDASMIRCRPMRARSDSLLEAATQTMLAPSSSLPRRFRSTSSPVELMQSCIEAGLVRELSLCAAEKFRFIPVADPALFGRQFCFWTETSDNPGFQENKFSTCASCSGRSCTTENTPLRAWQLKDRVCLSHPC